MDFELSKLTLKVGMVEPPAEVLPAEVLTDEMLRREIEAEVGLETDLGVPDCEAV